uniref:Uncharacterized protein n=1 Tax=Panagrolaimus davidi TaxID=227884 RepID=A0A914PTT9_9BILA
MFTEIKLKIGGELGCVCIVLNSYRFYPLYKYFVVSAVSHGFENVQIIDTISALFYASLWNLNNLPENCDIIQQNRWFKDFKLWQKRSDIVTLKDSIDFNKTTIESKIKEGLLCDEAIVIHHKSYSTERMKNYFPNFDYFSVEGYEKNVGALYKARMMGNDPDLNYLDVESKHGTSVILRIDDVEILRIEYGEILPLTKIFEYELPAANSILTVT